MKSNELSLAQLVAYKSAIKTGSSLPVLTDDQGRNYTARIVTGYQAAFLANTENGNLAKAVDSAIVGIRSTDKKKLASGVNHLVFAVRVCADVVATAPTDESGRNAAIQGALWDKKAKAPLYNSEISFRQEQELFRCSGRELHNAKASTSNADDFKEISPVVIRENKDFDINIITAGSPAAVDMVLVEYQAIEFGLASA